MEGSPEDIQATLREATSAYEQGRLDEAIDGFDALRKMYLAANDEVSAAEMANNLCVALIQSENPQRALDVVEPTPQIFLAVDDQKRAGRAYGNMASAYEGIGDLSRASECYQSALEHLSAAGDDEGYSFTLQALSRLQLRSGQPVDALSTMQLGLNSKPKRTLKDRLLSKLLNLPTRFSAG
jgi:tetratricopeptide (TPR) repeat protein